MPARLGQHFLADAGVARRIAQAVAPRPGERILEIGGGRGALTEHLLAALPSGDAPSPAVRCVELDAELAAALGQRFPRVDVVRADVLTLRLEELSGGDPARWAIAGNIPYAITSPILAWLCDQWRHVDRAVLMMQTEVAERLVSPAGTKAYGRLTVMVRYRAVAERLFDVPASSFRPPPNVGSTVVELFFAANPAVATRDERRFFQVVEIGFRWRRKTLRSVLRMGRGLTAAQAEAALGRAGIDPERRAETLDLAEFAALADALGAPLGP